MGLSYQGLTGFLLGASFCAVLLTWTTRPIKPLPEAGKIEEPPVVSESKSETDKPSVYVPPPPDPSHLKPDDFIELPKEVIPHRDCLVKILEGITDKTQIFKVLPPASVKCFNDHLRGPKSLAYKVLSNNDDEKQAFMPKSTEDSCTLVTLGIGNDVTSERKMKQSVPGCKFYGADPTPDNGKVYKSIGEYFPLAVGVGQGISKMHLFLFATQRKGHPFTVYEPKNMQTTDFIDFIETKAKVRFIDHLWIDNEGPEYIMFHQYFLNGYLRKRGITVCQISVEFHDSDNEGPEKYGTTYAAIGDLFSALLKSSDYTLLWGESRGHSSQFLFNFRSKECVRKYLGWSA